MEGDSEETDQDLSQIPDDKTNDTGQKDVSSSDDDGVPAESNSLNQDAIESPQSLSITNDVVEANVEPQDHGDTDARHEREGDERPAGKESCQSCNQSGEGDSLISASSDTKDVQQDNNVDCPQEVSLSEDEGESVTKAALISETNDAGESGPSLVSTEVSADTDIGEITQQSTTDSATAALISHDPHITAERKMTDPAEREHCDGLSSTGQAQTAEGEPQVLQDSVALDSNLQTDQGVHCIKSDLHSLSPTVREDIGSLTPTVREDIGSLSPTVREDIGSLSPTVREDIGISVKNSTEEFHLARETREEHSSLAEGSESVLPDDQTESKHSPSPSAKEGSDTSIRNTSYEQSGQVPQCSLDDSDDLLSALDEELNTPDGGTTDCDGDEITGVVKLETPNGIHQLVSLNDIPEFRSMKEKLQLLTTENKEMKQKLASASKVEEELATTVKERDALKEEIESFHSKNADEIYMAQIKEMELTIARQEKEVQEAREKLASHDTAAKRAIVSIQSELKGQVERITKVYEECRREKESMVMKYAQSEQKNLELAQKMSRMDYQFREMTKKKKVPTATLR